jgi:LmbE family N-acetylglucosaminyl deacetylase
VAVFKPSDHGISSKDWSVFFSRGSLWEPKPGPLVVVAPHPDDEILGAGGLIRKWALSGHGVTIVSVTDGEAADREVRDLALIRRRELRSALRRLCDVHVTVERLGIPDGQVEQQKNRLSNALADIVGSSGTLIGPYERDGHPDHDATGQVCCAIAQRQKVSLGRYPVWTWHHTHPSQLPALNWGKFDLEADSLRAKIRAIDCFASQRYPSHGDPILPQHVVTHFHRPFEAFVL